MSDELNDKNMEDVSNVTKDTSKATSKSEVADASTEVTTTEKESSTLTETELRTLDYSDFSTPARMLALGKVLVRSQLVPLKKPEDVVVALMTGKELGLPFVTSVSQIYPINGRPTLGVHIQRALCLKQGITFEKIEDAESIYQFAKTDKEGKIVLEDKKPVIVHVGTIKEQPDNTKQAEITKRTKIKAT